MEYEGDGDSNCKWCTWNNPQKVANEAEGVRNWKTNQDHPNYSIVEVGQNTEKSPEDLRRPVVTQTPVKDHHLMLVWKTFKE